MQLNNSLSGHVLFLPVSFYGFLSNFGKLEFFFEGDVRLTGGYKKKRKKKLIFVNLTFKVYNKKYTCQIIKYKKYCSKVN